MPLNDPAAAVNQFLDQKDQSPLVPRPEAEDPLEQLRVPEARTPAEISPEARYIGQQLGVGAERRLQIALDHGRPLDPDREARVLRLRGQTGLPVEYIRENVDELETLAATRAVNTEWLVKNSPRFSAWLQRRNHAALAKDDIGRLSGIEWLSRAAISAFRTGEKEVALGLGEFARQGRDDPSIVRKALDNFGIPTERQMRRMEKEIAETWFGEETFLERAWVEGWRMLPQVLGAATFSAAGAAAAFHAGQAGPQALTGEEVVTVPGAALAGAGVWTYIQEQGHLHRELRQQRDAQGNPLPPHLVALLSGAGGVGNSALELAGMSRFIPKQAKRAFTDLFTTQLIRATQRQSFTAAAARFGRQYGEALVTEGATEFAQELTSAVAVELAKSMADGDWQRQTAYQMFDRAVEAGITGFEASVFLGLGSHGPAGISDAYQARRAQRTLRRLELLSDTAKASKLRERAEPEFKALVAEQFEGTGASHVYVKVEHWNRFWQSWGADPQQIARETLSNSEQYEQAIQAGPEADLVIPIEDYLSRIGPTDAHAELVGHLRLKQEDMSYAEIRQTRDEQRRDLSEFIQELSKRGEQRAPLNKTEREIYFREVRKLSGVRPQVEVEAMATLNARMWARMAERTGRDPLEYYSQYEVSARRVGDIARAAQPKSKRKRRTKLSARAMLQRAFHGGRKFLGNFSLDFVNSGEGKVVEESEEGMGIQEGAGVYTTSSYMEGEFYRVMVAGEDGQLYVLDVPEENQADWWSPLGAPEQPAGVKAIAQAVWEKHLDEPFDPSVRYAEFYWRIAKALARQAGHDLSNKEEFTDPETWDMEEKRVPEWFIEAAKETSRILDAAGITGHSFWSENEDYISITRDATGGEELAGEREFSEIHEDEEFPEPGFEVEGTPRNYIIYNPDRIKIERRLYQESGSSIKAYHGGRRFEGTFSTEHMGTGEGIQAYGWGTYFADSPDVSINYYDAMGMPDTEMALYELVSKFPEQVFRIADVETGATPFAGRYQPSEDHLGIFDAVARYIQEDFEWVSYTTEEQLGGNTDADELRKRAVAIAEDQYGGVGEPGAYELAIIHALRDDLLIRIRTFGTTLRNFQKVVRAREQQEEGLRLRGALKAAWWYATGNTGPPADTGNMAIDLSLLLTGLEEDFQTDPDQAYEVAAGFDELETEAMLTFLRDKAREMFLEMQDAGATVTQADDWNDEVLKATLQEVGLAAGGAQLYKVAITNGPMLLWDRKISEMPPEVQNILVEAHFGSEGIEGIKSSLSFTEAVDLYNDLQETFKGVQHSARRGAPNAALIKQVEEVVRLMGELLETPPDVDIVPDSGALTLRALTAEMLTIKQNSGGMLEHVADMTGQRFYRELPVGTDKERSLWLANHGIVGIKYLDGFSRRRGEGTYNYVIFQPEKHVNILSTFFQGYGYDGKPQEGVPAIEGDGQKLYAKGKKHENASITGDFGPAGRNYLIELYSRANASSLFHEHAHFYLKLLGDASILPNASEQLRKDYRKALRFLGVKASEIDDYMSGKKELSVQQHERWARAFEQYLREGKAPSIDLSAIFARLRRWMMEVYGAARKLVSLNPEIEEVFDRLLASENEIQLARDQNALNPSTVFAEGLTLEEQKAYHRQAQRAKEAGGNAIRAAMLQDINLEMEDWFDVVRRGVRAQIREKMDKVPVWRALSYLQYGQLPAGARGSDLPVTLRDATNEPMKLSKRAILESYGEETLKALRVLQPWVYQAEGGAHPDDVAAALGFDSGDELLQALGELREATKFPDVLEQETDLEMRRRYGSIIDDHAAIAEEAASAAGNEETIRMLILEMRFLWRRLGNGRDTRPPITMEAMKDRAQALVGAMRVSDLRPGRYLRAAQSAGTKAFNAAKAGRIEDAYDAKALQVWQMVMFRAARDTQVEVDKQVRAIRNTLRPSAVKRRVLAGQDYEEQHDAIAERYAFKEESGRQTEKRQSLRAWVAEKQAADEDPLIPDSVLDRAERVHHSELSVQELQDVHDALISINHLAKLKSRLLDNKKRREYKAVIAELVKSAEALPDQGLQRQTAEKTVVERGARVLQELASSLQRVEEYVRRLDGGKLAGIWHRTVFFPIAEAQAAEADMVRKIMHEQILPAFNRLPEHGHKDLYKRQVHSKKGKGAVTRSELLVVALNWGNQSNRDRLLSGGQAGFERWDQEVVEELLGQLNVGEWEFVQAVWDALETLWPEASALEKRLTGVAPPQIPRLPFEFTTEDGKLMKLKGGYLPIVFDTDQAVHTIKGQTSELFGPEYFRASTPHGHLKERVDKLSGHPLLLDMNIVLRHIQYAVHDLTHREAVLNIAKILRDPKIQATLKRRLGVPAATQFEPWLKYVANNREAFTGNFWERAAGKLRVNVSIATLAWKVGIATQNFGNFFNLMEPTIGVRPGSMARAMQDTLFNRNGEIDFIYQNSGELRNRFDNLDRDMRQTLHHLRGKRDWRLKVVEYGFAMQWYTDVLSAYPGWLAAYREGVAQGLEHEVAVQRADGVIRKTISAAGPKDLSAMQRGGEFQKWLTMFYTWMGNVFVRGSAVVHDARQAQRQGELLERMPEFLARTASWYIIPAILGEILAGRTWDPDDEDEGPLEWMAYRLMFYGPGSIPIMREFARLAESQERGYIPDVQMGPAERVLEDLWRMVKEAGRLPEVLEGERDPKYLTKATTRVGGYLFGLPTGQGEITGGYIMDLMRGEDSADDPIEFFRELLYRRPPADEREK